MFVEQKIKIKRMQMKTSDFLRKLHQQSKKIALAVVITEFIMAGTYAGLIKYEVLPLKKEVIVVERVIAKETPVEVKNEATEEFKEVTQSEKIADIIYLLESTNGKNNYSKCEAQGLVNGSGFGIDGSGKYMCFKDREEEKETVSAWFDDKLKKYSEPEAICGYNLGFNSPHMEACVNRSIDYPYYRNYLTAKNK
jgi:hypothetical protein